MLNRILIPLDGSQLAERALTPGLQLTQRAEASLIVVRSLVPQQVLVPDAYVLGGYGVLWPNQSLELTRKEAVAYLKSIREHRIPSGLPAKLELIEGDPAEAIVNTARAGAVSLVVMSSHGYSGVTRWVLGSVAERVLHDAPCPVIIVRSSQPIRHILIPLDGSPLSEQVLSAAVEVAELLECKVTLLRAIRPVTANEVADLEKIESGMGKSIEEELQHTAEDYLRQVASAQGGRLSEIQTIVMHGSPAESILDYAALHAVDMIAMSTHGRTGFRRWVYGSVTEKILRAVGGHSMLVVRPEPKP